MFYIVSFRIIFPRVNVLNLMMTVSGRVFGGVVTYIDLDLDLGFGFSVCSV